jgi:hypothetical protein
MRAKSKISGVVVNSAINTVFGRSSINFMNRPYDKTYRRAINEPRERV